MIAQGKTLWGQITDVAASRSRTLNLDKGVTEALAEYISAETSFAVDDMGAIYYYSGGVYRPDGDAQIERSIIPLLAENNLKWYERRGKEVVGYIKRTSPKLESYPDLHRINLINGIYNLATDTLEPHSPENLTPIQLPVTYNPDATCPNWLRFLSQVLDEDEHDTIMEMIGVMMVPDVSFEKCFCLIGEGSNGKSILEEVVSALIGEANISRESLKDIVKGGFVLSSLVGKLMNVDSDLPSSRITDSSIWKKVVTGNPVTADQKYIRRFSFRPYSRLLFSANQPPSAQDGSDAYQRRWSFILFQRKFEGDNKRPRQEMLDELANPAELSGIFLMAVEGYKRLKRQNHFTVSPAMKRLMEEFSSSNDFTGNWIRRHLVPRSGSTVEKQSAYDLYLRYCDEHEISGVFSDNFFKTFKKVYPKVGDIHPRINGERPRLWKGLSYVQ